MSHILKQETHGFRDLAINKAQDPHSYMRTIYTKASLYSSNIFQQLSLRLTEVKWNRRTPSQGLTSTARQKLCLRGSRCLISTESTTCGRRYGSSLEVQLVLSHALEVALQSHLKVPATYSSRRHQRPTPKWNWRTQVPHTVFKPKLLMNE
jgi:hypothetical protein